MAPRSPALLALLASLHRPLTLGSVMTRPGLFLSLLSSTPLLAALLAFSQAAEPIVVHGIDRQPDQLTLSWNGGRPPFVVQGSQDLQTWLDLGQTNAALFTETGIADGQRFFRIRSNGDLPLGEPIGEWRVAQGEFGVPLARHRLKSRWEFFPTEEPSSPTARAFFSEGTFRIHYLDGLERRLFVGRLGDLPDAEMTTSKTEIRVDWTWGSDEWKRDLTLTLSFQNSIDALRFDKVNLSDPDITLAARYETPKPTLDPGGEMTLTLEEDVTLAEIDESAKSPEWWNRRFAFTERGVTVDTAFRIGVPLMEGEPPFIFKTPLLVHWKTTTITDLTSQPIVLTDRFSQTYFPFHHNFVETLWLDPALEPGIDPAILAELKAKNIRFIVAQNPTAFPEQKPVLRFLGFDKVLRDAS